MCEDFLKYCLHPNIARRATVEELFEHPFVKVSDQETKKSQATSSHLVNSLTASHLGLGQVFADAIS